VTPPSANVVTTVKGKFCPKSQNQLAVLFVVDYSGSMGAHVDNYGGTKLPGNDPQVNGSCGRLVAAQAVMAQIQANALPTDNIQLGIVPFAGGVVTSKVVPMTPLDQFVGLVDAAHFCQYVVQDSTFGVDPANPGGIDGSSLGIDASTNYVAAFTASQSLLQNVYGRKEIYFMSDGEPTRPGDGTVATDATVQASVAAGAALQASVDNLTFNGLLLLNAEIGTHAQDILTQVTGSADRVRLASDASQLAAQITQFPNAGIDPNSGRATLTVAPYPVADLGLQTFVQDPANPDQWDYETKPFALLGVPGQTTLNTVTVTAKGLDGTSYQSVVQIQFQE
jgi:hypothetical protein